MKISTFEDDLFGLEPFATRLEEFIKVEQDYIVGSLVIALSSSFGSGKSTFLDMWRYSLENREDDNDKPLVVDLNAWESDYYGDPLFAIISALIDKVKKEKGKSAAANLIDAAKGVGWFATAMGNQIAAKLTGIDAIAIGEFTQKKLDEGDGSEPLKPDSFSVFEDRKNAMVALKDAIQSFVGGYGSQVLFLVDELDRCRPDYAISYLETIKHLFDVKGAVFLLAADRQQLECSAKQAFGANLKFDEYYRKFVHREISLPIISHEDYRKLALKYVPYYLERVGARNCSMNSDSSERISELIAALELTPRQIQEVFRILGHIFETTPENRGSLLWYVSVSSIMMAALKVGRLNIFNRFGRQSVPPKEAFAFLKDLLGESDINWWFAILLRGGALQIQGSPTVEETFKEVGIHGESLAASMRHWNKVRVRPGPSHFAETFERIEQLSKWI